MERCRHDSEGVASMAEARRQVGKREKSMLRAQSPAIAESRICSKIKDKHDHTRETGLARVTHRDLRALAATPQRPASCTPKPGPMRGRTNQTQRPLIAPREVERCRVGRAKNERGWWHVASYNRIFPLLEDPTSGNVEPAPSRYKSVLSQVQD